MKRSFYFHYNKPASKTAGEPRLSIHYAGACYIVKSVDCEVPIKSRNRKKQPHCVMSGRASEVFVSEGHATIL